MTTSGSTIGVPGNCRIALPCTLHLKYGASFLALSQREINRKGFKTSMTSRYCVRDVEMIQLMQRGVAKKQHKTTVS